MDAEMTSILQRLHLSTLSSARRTQSQITQGIALLAHQGRRQKSNQWLNDVAWQVDVLKTDAMNGLDIMRIANETDQITLKDYQSRIRDTCGNARNALFSAASPLQCAHNFSRSAKPFVLLCVDVATKLSLIAQTQTPQPNQVTHDLAKPAQGQEQHTD